MPAIIPVAAALWSVGSAYSVGLAAMSTFQIIGTVSAVVGAVGAATGNKTLKTIGMIGSVVSSVGSFAQASGWLETASGGGLKASSGAAFNKAVTEGRLFKPYGSVTAVPPPGAGAVLGAQAAEQAGTESGRLAAQDLARLNPGLAGADAVVAGADAAVAGADAAVAGTEAAAEGGGLWASFSRFSAKNPEITYAGITTTGQAVSGLFDPTIEGVVAKNDAETAMINQQTAILEQQRANMAAPLAPWRSSREQALYDPITGRLLAPNPTGLLNTVTGAPA